MTVKVELGYSTDGIGGDFLRLDDPFWGRLDGPGTLGGVDVFKDVTEYFINVSINRGKSRELDRYQSGQATVSFRNNTRAFDPTFEDSPFFGDIIPKREVKISVDGEVQFRGNVDDWNISYEPGGNSVASLSAFDAFAYLTSVELDGSYAEENTATRIQNVLDDVSWPEDKRQITGAGATLAGTTVASVNALDFLQTTADSDPGDLFMSADGDLKFVGRNTAPTSNDIVFADDGSGIAYKTIQALYGSELLYNVITVTSPGGTAVGTATTSFFRYGERDFDRATFLNSEQQTIELKDYLLAKYGEPEFRFEGITIDLREISSAQRSQVLALEMGDLVKVLFTPSNVAPQIERFGQIIGKSYRLEPGTVEEVTFKLRNTSGGLLVLDDEVFGRLDEGNLLGW